MGFEPTTACLGSKSSPASESDFSRALSGLIPHRDTGKRTQSRDIRNRVADALVPPLVRSPDEGPHPHRATRSPHANQRRDARTNIRQAVGRVVRGNHHRSRPSRLGISADPIPLRDGRPSYLVVSNSVQSYKPACARNPTTTNPAAEPNITRTESLKTRAVTG